MKKILLFLSIISSVFTMSGQITAPFTESFNSGLPTGWANNSIDPWKFGGTMGYDASSVTDHTGTLGSVYAWIDGSGGTNASAPLTTDSINMGTLTTPELSFYLSSYNTTNASTGFNTFTVDFYDGSAWHDSVFVHQGDLGPMWTYVVVDLSIYTITGKCLIRFDVNTTTAGTAFYNDIAIDDIKVDNAPPCPLATGLKVNAITAFTAELDWNPVNGATGYEVIYDTVGFDPAVNGTSVLVTPDSLNLTGLMGATTYQFYVISDCGINGIGDTAGPVTFKTSCVPLTGTTYSNNFANDATGNPPSCWTTYTAGPNANFINANVVNHTGPYSTPNHLAIYSYALGNDSVISITPQFTTLPAKDKQISFYAKSPSSGNGIIVGTLSSPTNIASFSPVDTIMVTSGYVEYILYFDSLSAYNGVDEYIGLMHNSGATFSTIYVDDFNFAPIPACPKPTSLSLVSKTDTTATISYVGTGGAHDIFWGPTGFLQGSPGLGLVTSSSNPHTIDSLLYPGGCFDVYVRKNCGVNGLSVWAGPLTFCTNCATQQMPFYESFTNWPLNCWDTVGGSRYWAEYTTFGGPPTGIAEANFWGWPNPNDAMLTTAPVNISAQAQIRFQWAHLYNSSYPDDALAVMVEKNGSGIWDTVRYLTGPTFTSPGAQSTAPPVSQPFIEEIIVLDSAKYTGHNVSVRLWAISDYGPDLFIDNFYVEQVPSCIPPSASGMGVGFVSSNSANVFWSGGLGVSSNIQWGTVGFTPGAGNPQGSVPGNDSTYTITGLTANTNYEFYVQDSCTGSAGLSSWVGPFAFRTACSPFTAPYTQSFDGPFWVAGSNTGNNDSIDPCWTRNPDGSSFSYDWSVLNGPSIFGTTTGPATDNSGTGNFLYTEVIYGSANDIAYMISPIIDVSGLTVPYVEFYSHRWGSNLGNMEVQVNDGSGWTTMITLTGQEQSGAADPWKEKGFDISSFGDTIQVRFKAISSGCCSGAMAIDDFAVKEAPSCPTLAGQMVGGVTDSSASFTWFASSSATSYEMWIGPIGFYQGTATTAGFKSIHMSDSVYTDTLSANTCYEYLVRAICGPGDTSQWSGPISWCTPCVSFNAPYIQTYDNWPLSCWQVDAGSFDWVSFTGGYAEASFWSNSTGEAIMISPVINLNANVAQVEFDWSHLYSSSYPDDRLVVIVNKVGTTLMDTIVDISGPTTFNDPTAGNLTPGNFINRIEILDSATYANSSIQVHMIGITDYGPDLFINDFKVKYPVSDDLALLSGKFSKKSKCLSASDTAIFEVKNVLGSTVNFATNPLTINYSVMGPVNTTSSVTVNTGSLLVGDTVSVLATNIDLSTPGVYTMNAWLSPNSVNLDALNDTLLSNVNITVYDVFEVNPDSVVTITNTTDTVVMEAKSPFLSGGTFFFSEICHYYNFGSNPGTIPPYLTADDYVEITGVPGSDLGGITFEQWSTTALMSSYTFPPGTLIGPNGTAIIMTGQGGGASQPANFMYDGRGTFTGTFSSGGSNGRILKSGSTIIDAVGYNTTYSFPAASGVTAADWSGFTGSTSGTAGIRLNGADNNTASNWSVVTATNPQNAQVINAGVSVPAGGATTGFSWMLNGMMYDTLPKTVGGPYSQSGIYNYIVTLPSPCGTFTDTVTVIVNLGGLCLPPTTVTPTVEACDSVVIDWTGAADSAIVSWVATGGTPTGGTLVMGDSTYTITGTSANTTYDVYVANICNGDTAVGGPYTFSTGNVGAPVAAFTWMSPGWNLSVDFDASTSTGNGNTYTWKFGDGNTGTGETPTHVYGTGGTMTVTLIVSNSCGVDSVTTVLNGISLQEVALGASVAIFPNPAKDVVNLELEFESDEDVVISVLSVSGKLIFSKSYETGSTVKDQLDVSNLADGVYMIKIETSRGSVNHRLIKE